jgi:hypothetical protein
MKSLPQQYLVLSILAICWMVSQGQAQFGPYPGVGLNRPTTSPYLNLTRPGIPGVNYYNLVRPEFEFRNAVQGLQGQLNQQQQTIARDTTEAGLPVTGHATRFQNYSHYFPTGKPGTSLTQQTRTAATQQHTPPPRGGTGSKP